MMLNYLFSKKYQFRQWYALIVFVFFINSYSQVSDKLDSLIQISKIQKGRTLVKTLNEVSWEYRNSKVDSALLYARRSLKEAQHISGDQEIASAYHNIASSFMEMNVIDSAKIYHQKSLAIKLKLDDIVGVADTYNNLGIIKDLQGDYELALKEYFKALKIYEDYSKDFEKVPTVLVNIGIVYKKQKEYKKVLEYYERALDIYKENNFKIGEAIVTGNIGSVLLNVHEYEKSMVYLNQAKNSYNKLGYTRYIPYVQTNIAIAKDSLGHYEESRKDFLTAIDLFIEDENLYELVNTKIALSNNYLRSKEYSASKKELVEAIKISEINNFKEFNLKGLAILAKLEASKGNYKNAYKTQRKYEDLKDSLFETKKVKTIFDLEVKYQTEKKEKQILSQRADLAEKELNINQKNTQIIGLVLLAIVISILAYLLYNQQKLKNIQLKKEGELKEALIKIKTQNSLQEQRLRISRDLHDNIGAQLTFIISSIENLQYGFKIKNESLTNKLTGISDFAKDTIYELRDTIWAMNKNSVTIDDLQARISNFIDKANLALKDTIFSFKIDEKISIDVEFTSVKGMNIYRVIQESVNNAIKYADASKIEVCFNKIEDGILVSITDDGTGFDEAEVRLGSGLSNMRKRIADIDGEFEIVSIPNKGTKVSISV